MEFGLPKLQRQTIEIDQEKIIRTFNFIPAPINQLHCIEYRIKVQITTCWTQIDKMEFGIKDIIYLGTIVVAVVGTFLGTRHNLIEYVRDKFDILKDQIQDQKVEIEKLKVKDENQQQIIEQFRKQILDHLPALFEALKQKTKNV